MFLIRSSRRNAKYLGFSIGSRSYASPPGLRAKLESVVKNFDEYKKYADEYEQKLRTKVDPTRTDFALRKLLKTKIDEYLDTNAREIVGKKPPFVLRHPLVYKALGIRISDLAREKILVDKIKQFIKAGDISRSIILVRLVRGKPGTIGMNMILHHLASEGRLSLAKKIKSACRKWGIEENDYTQTALLAFKKKSANEPANDAIVKINEEFDRAVDKISSKNANGKQVVINDYLKKMTAFSTIDELETFVNKLPTKDVATYTIVYMGLAKNKFDHPQDAERALEFVKTINSEALDTEKALDHLYLQAYAIVLCSIGKRLTNTSKTLAESAYRDALEALKTGFDLGRFISREHAATNSKSLQPLGPLEFDLLLKSLLETNQTELLIKAFDKCFNYPESSPVPLEGNHVDNYVEGLLRQGSDVDTQRIKDLVQKVYFDKTIWRPKGLHKGHNVVPTAKTTGSIIAILTSTSSGADNLSFNYLRQIIEAHRSLRNTDLVFVEVLHPYVKALCRVFMDHDYRQSYRPGRNDNEPVDFIYSFRLLQNGLKTLLFNIEKAHCRDLCVETLNDMKSLAEYILKNYGVPEKTPDLKFFLKNVTSLLDSNKKAETELVQAARGVRWRISQKENYIKELKHKKGDSKAWREERGGR